MVDVVHVICTFDGCTTRASFKHDTDTKVLFCAKHKKNGMISNNKKNIKNKICKYEGCTTRPYYNFEGEKTAMFCVKHKEEGMEDIITKKCLDCKSIPSFNYKNETKAIYCSNHKKEDMIDVVHKMCPIADCNKHSIYNYEKEKNGVYCSLHKKDGMINVVSKTCKSSLCDTHISNKYDGYCAFCYYNLFPDKPNARNYKTKEIATVEYVKTHFPNIDWIFDKKVFDGCSRRRPDMLADLGYQLLIIEVDENQHQNYDCSCENKRLMELSKDFNHRPIIFIRFNPDKYFNYGTTVHSCWGLNKMSMCVIKNKKDWEHRLDALKSSIEYWCDEKNATDKTIEVVELFYDIM